MRFYLLFLLFVFASCSQKFYIVRHAEKAAVNPDSGVKFDPANPPLSEAGMARAQLLKNKLSGKKIRHIFSTKYTRTVSTIEPLAQAQNLKIQLYTPFMDSVDAFIERLKKIEKGNVIVVGHSNTVDDLINHFMGEKKLAGDLPETEYDNLFIISRKKDKLRFKREKFGDSGGADRK